MAFYIWVSLSEIVPRLFTFLPGKVHNGTSEWVELFSGSRSESSGTNALTRALSLQGPSLQVDPD